MIHTLSLMLYPTCFLFEDENIRNIPIGMVKKVVYEESGWMFCRTSFAASKSWGMGWNGIVSKSPLLLEFSRGHSMGHLGPILGGIKLDA